MFHYKFDRQPLFNFLSAKCLIVTTVAPNRYKMINASNGISNITWSVPTSPDVLVGSIRRSCSYHAQWYSVMNTVRFMAGLQFYMVFTLSSCRHPDGLPLDGRPMQITQLNATHTFYATHQAQCNLSHLGVTSFKHVRAYPRIRTSLLSKCFRPVASTRFQLNELRHKISCSLVLDCVFIFKWAFFSPE